MSDFLDRHDIVNLPSAIFCACDSIAYGCMEVLASRGIRVPEEVSVAGFDDSFLAQMTVPRLTTMRHPLQQMGRRAVELLLDLIGEERLLASGDRASAAPDLPIPLPRI